MAQPLDSITPKPRPARPSPAAAKRTLPSPEHHRRVKAMWFAVIVTMVVIVGGWMALTKPTSTTTDVDSGQTFFQSFTDQLESLFSGDRRGNVQGASSANMSDTERINDLRARVFPQFTNINE